MAVESKSKQIFDLYVKVGLIDEKLTPFEKWENANDRQKRDLFDLGVENNLFRPEDFEAFSSLWDVKKKDGEPIAQEEVSESVTQVQEVPGISGTSPLPPGSVVPGAQEEVVQEETVQEEAVPQVSAVKSINPFGPRGPEMTISMPQNVERATWIEQTPLGKNFVTDFFGDIQRAWDKGSVQGASIDDTFKLIREGKDISQEDLNKYIQAVQLLEQQGVSDEMIQFQKDSEEFGGGFWGGLAALIKGRGQIIPQVAVESFRSMFNRESIAQGGVAGSTLAGGAAALGQLGPQVALPEELVTVPTAFMTGFIGGSSKALDQAMTMQELIRQELDSEGLELNAENLRTVLNDEKNMRSLKNKALARGLTIGIIDGLTGGAASKVTSGVIKSGIRTLGRTGTKAAAATAGGLTEAVGGGLGELGGQVAAGQDISGEDILLEAVGGTGTAPLSIGMGLYEASKRGVYEINGKEVSRAEVFDLIDNGDARAVAGSKVNIENDATLKQLVADAKQEVKENAIIKRDVQQAGITDEADAAKMVELEKEKRKLKNNETAAGKRRIAELDAEIDAILDKAKPAEQATPVGEVVNIYEGVDKDGNKRQVEVTTTEEGVIEARLILENGERSQVVASAKGDISPQSVYKGLFDESKPIELVSTQETPATGVDVAAETEATAEAKADTEVDVDTEASKDLQQMIDDAGMEVTSVETKETVAQEATPETEEVTVVERKVNDNLSIADQDSKDTYYGSDQFAEENIEQDQDSHESMIMDRAKKAVNAIKKIAPNVKIVLHRNNNTYTQSTGSSNSRAVYDAGTNTIHINMPRAKESTIGHEVFHALLREKLGTDSKIQVATANMAKAIGKAIKKSKKLTAEQKTELVEYISQFNEETVQNEEAVAELLGVLSENYINLEPAQKGLVRRFIQKIIDLIGIDMDIAGKADADVINLLNTVSGKVARGQIIEEAEVAGIERAEQRKMKEAEISEVILTAYKEGVNTEKTKSDLIDLLTRRKAIREEAKDTEGAAKDQSTIEDLAAINMDQEAPPVEIFYEREIEEQRQKDYERRYMDAYSQAERERADMIENDLPFGNFLILHMELSDKGPRGSFAKMHAKDFDTYGDPSWRSSKGAGKKLIGGGKRSRRGTGAMQVNRLLTNEGTPSLDTEIESINGRRNTDFTPQDAIEYIMDRANNPGKYTQENVDLALSIEYEGADAVLGPVELSAETLADLESMRGQPTPATTEAAPVTQETTPATKPKKKAPAPLTEEQREVMSESRSESALNGLEYRVEYIEQVLKQVLDRTLSKGTARTFAALWRKHIDPNFSASVEVLSGTTFTDYIYENLFQLSQDLTIEENGMQKLIDLVNDANNKIEKKGGQTVDIVPLERTAPAVTEETAVTETTTEAAPVAELTAQQREFITEDDAGINGLAYTPNYIETVWDNIIDVLGDKSFTSLFKKHINEDFTSSMIEEELGEFSSTMIDLDDGMQKFIDLVNDANKRIKRKGGNQNNLMPLERTAPSSETLIEVGMTDENTEADFKRFEQEYKDRNPYEVVPFNDEKTNERKQARDAKAKQYAQEQVKKMLQESKAPKLFSDTGDPATVAAKPKKKAPAPKESKPFIPLEIELKIKENQEEIGRLESKISDSQKKMEDVEAEIESQKGNAIEEGKNFDTELAEIKDLDISRKEKANRRDGLKRQREEYMQKQYDLLGRLQDEQMGFAQDIAKAERKIKKLKADNEKLGAGTRTQRVEDVNEKVARIAVANGINRDGFFPRTMNNPQGLRKRLEALGYGLKETRTKSGYFITRGGTKWELPPRMRTQKIVQKDRVIKTQQLPKKANAADVVNFGKRNNFTVSQIKDYLVNTMGLSAKDAKKITEAELGLFNEIPASFLDIGINEGFLLFDRMKEYVNKLKKDNVPVMKRLEMVQDFLEKQPEYIAQADKNRKAPSTTQAKMMVDVKDALGLKAKKNAAQRMRELKKAIRNREKGARDLQQIKRKLRNFMRETLPKDVYTRRDVLDMIRKISDVNKINLDRMVNEVEEFVTKKQVAYLESEIDNILNGKYEVTANGRRKGVKIDSETAARIANIRDNLIVGPEATAKDVVERNEKLNDRIRELSQELNPTEEQANELVDLLAAMAINESKLSENNNPIKVTQLERANQILSETLDGGKQTFKDQIKKAHEKYKSEFVKVYKAITGIELDPNSENYKKEAQEAQGRMDRLAQERKLEKGMKKYINTTIRGIKNFLRYGESLEGLMDIISEAPGALIEALPDELVYEKINDSSRTYKKRQLQNQKILTAKIKETFGRKWKKAMKRGTIQKNTHVYKDVKRAKEAYDKYKKNRTIKNYRNWRNVLGEERIKLSPNEIAYLYQQYQDPANIPSFANPDNINFGPDHANIMKQLVEGVAIDPVTGKRVPIKDRGIDSRLLDFSNWMVEEFFPSRYDDYNATYKDIYRTNMPWNQYYAGRIYREGKTYSALDLLGNDAVKNGVVNAASTKDRRANNRPIKPQDMFNNLYTYLEDMEWFAAYGSQLRDINKLFSNPLIRRAITSLKNGRATLDMIDHAIKNVAARGIQSGKTNDFVNWINKGFINAKLGLNPTVALKQMLSAPAYANDIGYANYLKYMFKDKASMLKNFNEIRKNSVYVQDRLTDDFRKKIEAFNSDQVIEAIPKTTKNYFANAMMFFGRAGDIGAIFLGGMPNYAYYKDQYKKRNPQATEQEVIDYAIKKFERDTKTTQQSMDLQDRDYFQSSNALMRSLNMFLTTSKQYFRKELSGLRKMRRGLRDMRLAYKAKKAGVGDTKQIRQSGEQVVDGFRQFIQYRVFMPLAFQYVTIGLPGIFRDRREGDEDDLKRAMLLGNINALFIIGDLVMGVADMYQNKSYAGNQTGLVPYSRMNRLANLYKWAQMSGPEKRDKWMNQFYLELGEVFLRLPVGNMYRFYKNIQKLDQVEDPREVALRLMNFSDYVIEGGNDSFVSDSDGKSSKETAPSKPTSGVRSVGGVQKAK